VILETYHCNGCGRRVRWLDRHPTWRVGETRTTECFRCDEEHRVAKLAERLERAE